MREASITIVFIFSYKYHTHVLKFKRNWNFDSTNKVNIVVL